MQNSTHPIVVKLIEKVLKQNPIRRLGEALDIAKGVVFLSSSDASFITGANLVIDGGLIYNFQLPPLLIDHR